jgi:hypothetical protein
LYSTTPFLSRSLPIFPPFSLFFLVLSLCCSSLCLLFFTLYFLTFSFFSLSLSVSPSPTFFLSFCPSNHHPIFAWLFESYSLFVYFLKLLLLLLLLLSLLDHYCCHRLKCFKNPISDSFLDPIMNNFYSSTCFCLTTFVQSDNFLSYQIINISGPHTIEFFDPFFFDFSSSHSFNATLFLSSLFSSTSFPFPPLFEVLVFFFTFFPCLLNL